MAIASHLRFVNIAKSEMKYIPLKQDGNTAHTTINITWLFCWHIIQNQQHCHSSVFWCSWLVGHLTNNFISKIVRKLATWVHLENSLT